MSSAQSDGHLKSIVEKEKRKNKTNRKTEMDGDTQAKWVKKKRNAGGINRPDEYETK